MYRISAQYCLSRGSIHVNVLYITEITWFRGLYAKYKPARGFKKYHPRANSVIHNIFYGEIQ